jgi:glycosyl transferase family 25
VPLAPLSGRDGAILVCDLMERRRYMKLLDYFDRMAIIHLPDREDRFRALGAELSRIDIDIHGPKIVIPHAPMPETAHGYKSRGVYGSFLSHLEIIEAAYRDGLETVWVLEDDAIFSKRFHSQQAAVTEHLRANDWDMFFIGHSVWKSLPDSPTDLLRFSGPFLWAHAYAVHRRIMPRLIEYLHQTTEREVGHPEGGKVYIDAAYFLFRQLYPDVISVVSSPCFSVQKGSPSSLNSLPWFEKLSPVSFVINLARGLRDELWRQGLLRIDGPQLLSESLKLTSGPAETWPGIPR